MHQPVPLRQPSPWRLLLVVLAAILWAAASAGAQPAPSDPVKQLREALRGTLTQTGRKLRRRCAITT